MRVGSLPVPFRSVPQTKKERTEVLVKQLLKVSMENNTLEAEILAKVQRGVSGMEDLMMFFPGNGPDSVEKNLGTLLFKENEEVSVFWGCKGKICLERNLP